MEVTEINHNLPSKSSSGTCKSSVDFRVPKWLHQRDFASVIVVLVGKELLGTVYSIIFPCIVSIFLTALWGITYIQRTAYIQYV